MLTASIHENGSTCDVSLEEDLRVLDGTVYVRLGSKVNYYIRLLLFEKLINSFLIADVCLNESEIRIIHNRLECRKVTCICELIKADDPVVWMCLEHMEYEVASDKTCAACYDDVHLILLKN